MSENLRVKEERKGVVRLCAEALSSVLSSIVIGGAVALVCFFAFDLFGWGRYEECKELLKPKEAVEIVTSHATSDDTAKRIAIESEFKIQTLGYGYMTLVSRLHTSNEATPVAHFNFHYGEKSKRNELECNEIARTLTRGNPRASYFCTHGMYPTY